MSQFVFDLLNKRAERDLYFSARYFNEAVRDRFVYKTNQTWVYPSV